MRISPSTIANLHLIQILIFNRCGMMMWPRRDADQESRQDDYIDQTPSPASTRGTTLGGNVLRENELNMSYQILSLDAVAEYLHLTPADIAQRVKCNEIPHEKRGRRIVFSKDEIDLWASQHLLRLPGEGLTEYHRKSTRGTREILPRQTLLPEMIQPGFIAPALPAKTKSSVLHQLVKLAETTGRLNNPQDLVASLEAREALCSTGMPGGFALLHPRVPDPYLFESSFIVLARTVQEIHFGAPDAQPTNLFFLVCCQDDRLHLHTLARICLMARKTAILDQLRQSPDAPSMHTSLLAAEEEALAETKT